MEKELKTFRKLIVWQRAHELTLMIYKASERFPKHEMFDLTSQMRRSAVSVKANIAEEYALGDKSELFMPSKYFCGLTH